MAYGTQCINPEFKKVYSIIQTKKLITFLDDKDLDEDVKRIKCADSRRRESLGRQKGTILEGGPQDPSYEEMMAAKERVVKEEYQMLRKKWREQRRSNRLQAQKTTDFNDSDFTCNLCPFLHPMSDVCVTHLQRGHSFPDRDLVLLCTPIFIMPTWWGREQWRKQIPK